MLDAVLLAVLFASPGVTLPAPVAAVLTPLDRTAAMALIAAPPGEPVAPPPPHAFPGLAGGLRRAAVAAELLDERECRYVLVRREEFGADLNLLRVRHRDLKDAPRVAEAGRFPPRAVTCEACCFNRRYYAHLAERCEWELDRLSELEAAMHTTQQLYRLYDALRDAHTDYFYVTVRRQGLLKARELLGEERFLSGELPPPVPTWLFRESE